MRPRVGLCSGARLSSPRQIDRTWGWKLCTHERFSTHTARGLLVEGRRDGRRPLSQELGMASTVSFFAWMSALRIRLLVMSPALQVSMHRTDFGVPRPSSVLDWEKKIAFDRFAVFTHRPWGAGAASSCGRPWSPPSFRCAAVGRLNYLALISRVLLCSLRVNVGCCPYLCKLEHRVEADGGDGGQKVPVPGLWIFLLPLSSGFQILGRTPPRL